MRHWLMKSEPDVFGIEHLREKGTNSWDGVRGYQARNFMMEMAVGDAVIFYHSNAKPPGAAGLARVVKTAYPDHTAWDPQSEYFDPASTPEKPRWMMVDVGFVSAFQRLVPLDELRARPELAGMMLLTHGRLSVSPMTLEQYAFIVALGDQPAPMAAPVGAKAPRAQALRPKATTRAAKAVSAARAVKPDAPARTRAKPRPGRGPGSRGG